MFLLNPLKPRGPLEVKLFSILSLDIKSLYFYWRKIEVIPLTIIHPYLQQHFFVIKPPGPTNQDYCANVYGNSSTYYLPKILNPIEIFLKFLIISCFRESILIFLKAVGRTLLYLKRNTLKLNINIKNTHNRNVSLE